MAGYDTVSLLTDYGTVDEFVGVLKCVLRDLAPQARVIDLTHGIDPFDVRGGSLALARVIQYVPRGVIIAVVDPGVGTSRRAIAVEVAGGEGILLGPDNGLLGPAVAMAGGAERAVELNKPEFQLEGPGATFAGRDVFAPVAAHLCNGVPLEVVGQLVDAESLLPGIVPLSRPEGDEIVTEVLWVDRYGNAQLNVSSDDVETMGDRVRLRFGDTVRTGVRAASFGAVGSGQVGIVTDSYGLLSVALDRSSAAMELGLRAGDLVYLREADDSGTGTVTPVQLRR
jgi:S-adenosylmethionine hydrolase